MIIIPSILDTIKASEVQREFSITGIHVFLGNDIIRWELERSFFGVCHTASGTSRSDVPEAKRRELLTLLKLRGNP